MMEHVLATGAEEAKVAEVLARGLLEIIIGTGDEDLEVASLFSPVQRDVRVDRLAPENTLDGGGRRRVWAAFVVTRVDDWVSLEVLNPMSAADGCSRGDTTQASRTNVE